MEEEYKKLLNSLREQLVTHPLSEFKKGDLKRFFLRNAYQIKKASLSFTQKTLVEKLALDLNADFSYTYLNRVLNSVEEKDKKENPSPNVDNNQAPAETKPKNQVIKNNVNVPILDEDETDALGRKPYPVDNEITAEKIAEWAHLKLPNFAVRKLISFRISIEEWKALNYTIKSADSINAFVANYCQKKEDDWLESQRNKNT